MYMKYIGSSPEIDRLVWRLERAVDDELELQKEMYELSGALDMIITTSSLAG
jgi:hypothetical protein